MTLYDQLNVDDAMADLCLQAAANIDIAKTVRAFGQAETANGHARRAVELYNRAESLRQARDN